MVQREVADRFFAEPGTKAYGAVSVLVQLAARAHRLPPGLAHGLPAAAERRLGARRLPAHRVCRRGFARRQARRRGGVRAPAQDAAELARARRARDRARSGRRRSRAIGRDRRACAPRRSSRRSSSRSPRRSRETRARRAGEDQPRARRRPAARRRQARGRDGPPAHRPRRPRRASSRPTRLDGRRASPRTRSSRARSRRSPRPPASSRAGARGSTKRIPVAAGLGGGSSDAATALRLANALLAEPLVRRALHELAAALGADVPVLPRDGPQLGTGDGTELDAARPAAGLLRSLLVLPRRRAQGVDGATSTRRFDERGGEAGFEERRAALARALAASARRATSPRCRRTTSRRRRSPPSCSALGAFRADVSGAGPAVYGLFRRPAAGRGARAALAERRGAPGSTVPAWYG